MLQQPKPTPRLRARPIGQKRAPILSGPLVISVIALLVSIGSTYLNWFYGRDTAKLGAIREAYGTFFEISKLQQTHWQQSHLFALPDTYSAISAQVTSSVQPLTSPQRNEFLLKERAVADYIFTLYEQTFYLRRQAESVGDTDRLRFLSEVEDYLTGRMLRNPRLLWYWSAQGGSLMTAYEPATQDHYRARVLQDLKSPLASSSDATGPFK